MINWQSVLFNSLWIVGLALLLAGFSYSYWAARDGKRPLSHQLASVEFLAPFWAGMLLFCAGLAGTSERVWEIILWGLLALFSIFNLARLGWQAKQQEE